MTCYSLSDCDDLTVVPLDAMSAVYHRPSGQTHLVADPVPQLLACLCDRPASVGAIMECLIERHDLEAEGDAVAVVVARLDELAALGLIERSG